MFGDDVGIAADVVTIYSISRCRPRFGICFGLPTRVARILRQSAMRRRAKDRALYRAAVGPTFIAIFDAAVYRCASDYYIDYFIFAGLLVEIDAMSDADGLLIDDLHGATSAIYFSPRFLLIFTARWAYYPVLPLNDAMPAAYDFAAHASLLRRCAFTPIRQSALECYR
jgi:hypothetical protein